METKRDRAFFRDIFRPMRENFSDASRKTKLDDLPADWMAYELAVLFTRWAQLYTDPLYAAMDFDAFKKLNIETLYFDNAAWRSECRDADADPTCQPTNQSRGDPGTRSRLQARTRSPTDKRALRS